MTDALKEIDGESEAPNPTDPNGATAAKIREVSAAICEKARPVLTPEQFECFSQYLANKRW